MFFSCVSTGGVGVTQTVDGLSLEEAIEQSASDIAVKLSSRNRVAIIGFDSEDQNLSSYIMDELTGALVEDSLEVADRRNLAFVYEELNFQMSGDVSDETAVSIGKFLGARYVIIGQFIKAGDRYRYRVSCINVETAIQESSMRLNVRNDHALQNLIADVRRTPPVTAVADYVERGTTQPRTSGDFLDQGMLFASRRDWDMAITEYTAALQIDPNNAAALSSRGYAYLWKGDYDRAIADCTASLRIDPNNANVLNYRGNAHNSKGDYDRAITDLNAALGINPNNSDAIRNRGYAYLWKGDYDRAIVDYNTVIRIDPNNANVLNYRGSAYLLKGDYDRAIADCTASLRINPNNADAKKNLEKAQRRGR
jgi:tetratricopeptide (TPR) repeat protein